MSNPTSPHDIAARRTLAVLIPCHNEAAAIGDVVRDFRRALPTATIYVYDNNSTDRSVEIAREAGAMVGREPRQGKGNVVRRMFADIDADIFVIVDGDNTYDANTAATLVEMMVEQRLDMVNVRRVDDGGAAYRPGHRMGNRLMTVIVGVAFGKRLDDILSGYKVLSRRFVKSFPALSSGFEVETELAVHALELGMPIGELPSPYRERPAGSASKLRTVRDGIRILRMIAILIKEERPMPFFISIAAILAVTSILLAWSVLETFVITGLVPRLPTAVLATGLMLLAFLSVTCGLVLDTVTRGRREMKRLFYLTYRPP